MLLAENLICSFLALPEEDFITLLPGILFPDAVQIYIKNKNVSHFRETGSGIKPWKIPADMNLSKRKILASVRNVHSMIQKNNSGEEMTDISVFEKTNSHLPKDFGTGIKIHLQQDNDFQQFLSGYIDTSQKEKGVFWTPATGWTSAGNVREVIYHIMTESMYFLTQILYQETGILFSDQWLISKVKPVLYKTYGWRLGNKVISRYLQFPDPALEVRILKRKWDRKPIYFAPETYLDLNRKIIQNSKKIYEQAFG